MRAHDKLKLVPVIVLSSGLGLGLVIVRDLTRALGGDVRLIVDEQSGDAFEVSLPQLELLLLEAKGHSHEPILPLSAAARAALNAAEH